MRHTVCLASVTLLIACGSLPCAQQDRAGELLDRAVQLADLYNWTDASPAFSEAEQLFRAADDRKNALYAKLGRIRSNIERDQRLLPQFSAELAEALDDDPLLQGDARLRMFCLIVKGDIDTETNTGAMRQDWEDVKALAERLGDTKWQFRALAQLSMAAFYNADLETARKNVAAALAGSTKIGDVGGQIRCLSIIAGGFLQTKMYEQALAYTSNINKIAAGIPDAGYQFTAQEIRIEALIGSKQWIAARQATDELMMKAREFQRPGHESMALKLKADIADAHNEERSALEFLDQATAIDKSAGLVRLLAAVYARATEVYRKTGEIEKAEYSARLAAESTQASGDLWSVPQRLQEVAELQVARGLYAEADATYAQAETFLDALIGGVSTALEKTAVITASSQIYSEHFALVAEHMNDPERAYRIIEQVRGRVEGDLLAAGLAHTAAARTTERAISQLRLKLMASRSTEEIARLRGQIFMAEQARWATPLSVLKSKPLEITPLDRVQRGLPAATALLEYVSADPNSYCLMITRTSRRIVRLGGKQRIEARVHDYLKNVKSKMSAAEDARELYDALLGPMGVAQYRNLLIVRDGQLHLLPFDALRDPSGRFVVEVQNVVYGPSATSLFMLAHHPVQATTPANALLAVGGIPYSASRVDRSGIGRGPDHGHFADLPSSGDEVEIARAALKSGKSAALTGISATEAAFKAEDLSNYRVLHLAVHAFADTTFPERAALVLLSDRSAGEDGYLQASEVVQLRLNADLVVLSACDTAVGPLQGQEGIANLSQAFLLAGARTVVSTLWEVNDASSLFLMKHFYTHLVENQPAASALTAAKRDMLRTFGRKTPPYQWAGFTIEGAATRPLFDNRSEEKK